MWYWNCSTIVQTERVLKFQYPPAKRGTEIYVHLIIKFISLGIWYLNLSVVLTLNGGLYQRM